MKRAVVLCNGCPENMLDSERIRKYLEINDWYTINDPAAADLIVFNACALTDDMANFSCKVIQALREKATVNSKLIVCGCLPKIDSPKLKEVYKGPLLSEQDLYQLDDIIKATTPIDKIDANQTLDRYHYIGSERGISKNIGRLIHRTLGLYYADCDAKINLYRRDPSIFYIKTSTGCLGNCTYCSIRYARGKIKSKPVKKIISEFQAGLRLGFQEFSLLGTDLGAQGRDLGYNLVDLLKEMLKEKGEYKIGLRNVDPFFFMQMLDDFEPILSTKKVWYMAIAAESGSNRILRLMNRKYTGAEFLECIQRAKSSYPDLKIRTQFMVGFPTETELDFTESMNLLNQVSLDFIEVYRFSVRPKTIAQNMAGQIPTRISTLRQYRMLFKAQNLMFRDTLQRKSFARLFPRGFIRKFN